MNDREALKFKLSQGPELPGEDGFMTSQEISREMGWSIKRTVERLRELKQAGELEVRLVKRMNLANRASNVPGYRLRAVEEPEELTGITEINS